jgi:hypothetical protein
MPNSHYRFIEWSGDAIGAGSTIITMDAPKSVIANFAPPFDSCGKDGNPKASEVFDLKPTRLQAP